MIRSLGNKIPKIAESAFVSEAAYVVGDVEIGEHSSVWPGAVIRGDLGKIVIGQHTVVEDNCVLHSGSPAQHDSALVVGNHVVIGHGAVLNCFSIGNHVVVGMNATILHEAKIGDYSVIAANCMVKHGMEAPDHSLVVGMPGKIVGKATQEQSWWVEEGTKLYRQLAEKYKAEGL